MKDISCVYRGTNDMGNIYISGVEAAQSLSTLRKLHIKTVISIAKGCQFNYSKQDIPNYMYIGAEDRSGYDLSKHFDETYCFIDRNRHGNVLVHCVAGISRSATIVAAYLMRRFGYTVEAVILLMRHCRPQIDPNPGFMQQLKRQEMKEKIMGKQSMKNVSWKRRSNSLKVGIVRQSTQIDNSESIQLKDGKTNLNPFEAKPSQQLKSGKIVAKIQRIKTCIIEQISNSCHHNPSKQFINLLQSKIYKNKHKIRTPFPQ